MTSARQVADPICLACNLMEPCPPFCDATPTFPCSITQLYDGEIPSPSFKKIVCLTIGLFSIVQLERSVQMLVPAYDFCIPNKECCNASDTVDDPCELFKKIKFPTNEFIPPKLHDLECDC